MIILFHGHDPRDVVEGDGAETEVGVIRDAADELDEAGDVGGGDAVYGGDEVGWGEAVLGGGGAAALFSFNVVMVVSSC